MFTDRELFLIKCRIQMHLIREVASITNTDTNKAGSFWAYCGYAADFAQWWKTIEQKNSEGTLSSI